MVEKLCKNCKHWNRKTKLNRNYGYCTNGKFNYEYPNENEDDNLVYWDYESYDAAFETGQNFGCIHFEAGDHK